MSLKIITQLELNKSEIDKSTYCWDNYTLASKRYVAANACFKKVNKVNKEWFEYFKFINDDCSIDLQNAQVLWSQFVNINSY